jgi:hypothetical protein
MQQRWVAVLERSPTASGYAETPPYRSRVIVNLVGREPLAAVIRGTAPKPFIVCSSFSVS